MEFDYVEKTPITEIGCGTVVPFTAREETVTIMVPRGLAKPEQIETMIVRGPSLSDYGIIDGDVIAYRTNVTNKDVRNETVCAIRILSTGELTAKKIRKSHAGQVILRSSGGGLEDKYLDADDIEVLGVVFAAQKLADKFGCFRYPADVDIPW